MEQTETNRMFFVGKVSDAFAERGYEPKGDSWIKVPRNKTLSLQTECALWKHCPAYTNISGHLSNVPTGCPGKSHIVKEIAISISKDKVNTEEFDTADSRFDIVFCNNGF